MQFLSAAESKGDYWSYTYAIEKQAKQAQHQPRRPLNELHHEARAEHGHWHEDRAAEDRRPESVLGHPLVTAAFPPFFYHVVGEAAGEYAANYAEC